MVNVKKGIRVFLFSIMICAMVSVLSFAAEKITEDKAKSIALDAVDVDDVGDITDVELEEIEGVLVYIVEFTKDDVETDVNIDAMSGEVLMIGSDLDEMDED